MSRRRFWKIIILIIGGVLVTGLAVFLWRTDLLSRCRTAEQLRFALAEYEPWSAAVFFLLQLCGVIFAPIPSNLIALAGGLSFGVWKGFLLTFFAVNLGSSTTFLLARLVGKNAAQRLIGKKVAAKYQALLRRKRDAFLVMAFLLPFFPDDLLCIFASLTEISWKRFALIVLLTRHWGLLAASAIGASLFTLPGWALPVLSLAGVALFLLGILYGDRVEAVLMRRLHKGSPQPPPFPEEPPKSSKN